ncbi:hypothetical protein TgHK011_004322 [Trichoderma gracile]|nr:hypothetical protein TgHK011_004322 [Trichoderma gracile]
MSKHQGSLTKLLKITSANRQASTGLPYHKPGRTQQTTAHPFQPLSGDNTAQLPVPAVSILESPCSAHRIDPVATSLISSARGFAPPSN